MKLPTERDLGEWQLPKPKSPYNKDWHEIVRVTQKIPFGYAEHPENDRLLIPIVEELEALELAKRHLQQYSYRAVANWLTKETGRYISHMGLKKRVELEQRRKKAITIKRKFAKWLEKTLEEIEKLESRGVGAYSEEKDS